MRYDIVRYRTIWYDTVLNGTLIYGTVRYSITVRYEFSRNFIIPEVLSATHTLLGYAIYRV